MQLLGIMSYLTYDIIPEYVANEGVSKITLTWDDFVSARAVMIYNSINYDDSFMNIAKISMTYLADDEGNTGIVEMNSLNYDWDWNVDSTFAEMNPGGAIIAEFDELSINKIEITFASIVGCNVAIPEIVVLGKSESVAANNEWTDYSYTNPEFGSPDLINEELNQWSTHQEKSWKDRCIIINSEVEFQGEEEFLTIYDRSFDGPLSFKSLSSLAKEKSYQKLMRKAPNGNYAGLFFELMNLVGLKQKVIDIAAILSLEYNNIFSLREMSECLEILVEKEIAQKK